MQQTGAGGWPLVPSKRFLGELTLACPDCKSTNVILTCVYGSHPRPARLGNPGSLEVNVCQDCGKRTHYAPRKG